MWFHYRNKDNTELRQTNACHVHTDYHNHFDRLNSHYIYIYRKFGKILPRLVIVHFDIWDTE